MNTKRRVAVAGVAIAILAALLVVPLLRDDATAVRGRKPSAVVAITPTWRLTSYRHVGHDRSFKADLIDELPQAPRLVIFGGSRAMRFEPSYFAAQAGITAVNCAVQNCRPDDAFAFSSYLFSRAPDVKLDCFFAVQTTTFLDAPPHAGLLYDRRLARVFPGTFVARQKSALGAPPIADLLGTNRFSARGVLLRNTYDIGRERPNYSFSRHMENYIRRRLPKYRWTGQARQTRCRAYFEKTMRLFNDHGVVPAVVIMPYHPRALAAFRAAGWQKKVDALTTYLREAQTRCDFRVLNLLDIRSFGGQARWFYDGAHVTRENARLIIRHALRVAPECFR